MNPKKSRILLMNELKTKGLMSADQIKEFERQNRLFFGCRMDVFDFLAAKVAQGVVRFNKKTMIYYLTP